MVSTAATRLIYLTGSVRGLFSSLSLSVMALSHAAQLIQGMLGGVELRGPMFHAAATLRVDVAKDCAEG